MKKFLFLGLMSSVVISNSCSNTDNEEINNSSGQPQLLLSKITTVYYDDPANPQTTVSTLNYNAQRQLIKTISEGRASTFEYDNAGKPVKTIYHKPDGTVDYYSVYTYNDDQLVSVKAIYTNSIYNRTVTYNYNTNGQVVSSTLCQTPDCSNPGTDTYTYDGNNISSETSTFGESIIYSNKSDFSYDDKPNPFTNINKYLKIMMGRAYSLSKNNYLVEKKSFKNNGVWQQSQTVSYTMQYNSSGLPVQVVGKEADGSLSVQYHYEYITQ